MAMKIRALLSLGVVIATLSLAGCGHYNCGTTFGGGTCTPSGSGISQGNGNGQGNGLVAFGYFASFAFAGQPSVGMALQILDSSKGTFQSQSSFAPPEVPPYPSGITIVNKANLYVASSDGTLFSFAITPLTGVLTNIGTNPLAVTGGDSIASSPDGNWVFVGDTAGQRISVYKVNSDGSLTGAAGNPFPTSGVSPKVMATDGLSKFLYATGGPGSSQTAAFVIGSGGVLTAVSGSPFVTSIGSSMMGDPSGKFLLGASWTAGDANIHVYSIGASNGVLTSWTSQATVGVPRNVFVHPSGKWVYSFPHDPTVNQIQAVEGYTFSSNTGVLTAMGSSPFSAILANDGFIEQTGAFMIAVGHAQVGNSLTLAAQPVAIDSTDGSLSVWPGNSNQAEGFPGIGSAAYALTDTP